MGEHKHENTSAKGRPEEHGLAFFGTGCIAYTRSIRAVVLGGERAVYIVCTPDVGRALGVILILVGAGVRV